MRTCIIAAYDEDNVIGNDNYLPWHLPEDMKWFKDITTDHIVAMGRNTWDSLPDDYRPLPNRTNIIISRSMTEAPEGAVLVSSIIDAALYAALRGEDIYFIGGGEIYKSALEFVDKLYITHVNGRHEGDTYFPAINLYEDWHRIKNTKFDTHHSAIYVKRTSDNKRKVLGLNRK